MRFAIQRGGLLWRSHFLVDFNGNVIEILRTLVSMVISLLLRMVCEIKTGAVSVKFCVVSHGVLLFLVSLILLK